MALTRSQAAAELAAWSGGHLLAAGLATTDTATNLKEPLDATFRALGVAYGSEAAATVEAGDLDRFLAVGEVMVLRRAIRAASAFADIAATELGTSKKMSQVVENLRAALATAEATATAYGVAGVGRRMTSGTLTLSPAADTTDEAAA